MKNKLIVVAILGALAFSGNAFAGGSGYSCGYNNPCWKQGEKGDKGEPGTGGGTGVGVGVGTGGSVVGGNGAGGVGGDAKGGNISNFGSGNVDSKATTNSGDVSQGQGQGQSNDNSGNSSNENFTASASNSGGNKLSNGSESSSSVGDTSLTGGNQSTAVRGGDQVSDASNSGGNSSVSVDAADRSVTNYESQALVLPTIQTAAPALVANPALVVDRGVCGPRQAKVQERVNGTYVGLVKRSSIDLGVDDELTAAAEPYRYWTDPSGAVHVFGHQVVTFASVNGVAASRSVGLGGGKTGGDWGQAGASSGSSVQRTIIRIQLHECELPVAQREVLVEVPSKKVRE